jgi:hypothetical protein
VISTNESGQSKYICPLLELLALEDAELDALELLEAEPELAPAA